MTAKNSADRRSSLRPQHADPPTAPAPGEDSRSSADRFVQAAEASQGGLLEEFWLFLRESKKWWLTPIIVVLLLLAGLVVLAGTGAAPFIYTLF
jgi:hypothetical protein